MNPEQQATRTLNRPKRILRNIDMAFGAGVLFGVGLGAGVTFLLFIWLLPVENCL